MRDDDPLEDPVIRIPYRNPNAAPNRLDPERPNTMFRGRLSLWVRLTAHPLWIGLKSLAGAHQGGPKGGRPRKGPPDDQLTAEVAAKLARNPQLGREGAMRRVGERHGLALTTMYERLGPAEKK